MRTRSRLPLECRAVVFLGLLLVLIFSAACGGHSSSSTAAVAKVTVVPATASVGVGQFVAFTATAVDTNGNNISASKFTWTPSAPNVVSIDNNGVALGVGPGTIQITATLNGVVSAPSTLTVTDPVASIVLSPMSATIAVGGQQQFTATALDSRGNAISGVVFGWASSFAGTATISNGVATGVAPGTVAIVATASGISSPPAALTVTP